MRQGELARDLIQGSRKPASAACKNCGIGLWYAYRVFEFSMQLSRASSIDFPKLFAPVRRRRRTRAVAMANHARRLRDSRRSRGRMKPRFDEVGELPHPGCSKLCCLCQNATDTPQAK